MKKKLEAELISIAHRILKLKNKSELAQLHQETQKLYEKLSVLRFLEEQFDELRPTIGRAEVEARLEKADVEKPSVAEIPSEPLRMTENEFKPVSVFMPTEQTEDRGSDDEEVEKTTVQTEPLRETENDFTPVAVFMPKEKTEDRGSEDEEIQMTAVQTEPLPVTENEFKPISVITPEEKTEDRGFEDKKIEVTDVQNQEKEPEVSGAEIEREPEPEVETPHVIEIGEEERTEEEEPDTDDEILIKHVLHMDELYEDEDEDEVEFTKVEPTQEEVKSAPKEISFADLLGHDFSEPVFERIDDIKSSSVETPVFEKNPVDFTSEPTVSKETFEDLPYFKADVPKAEPSHEAHSKTITFGLNDKIGFEKHLFGGSSEEMNRVVSQLGSFSNFEEAKDFIEDMVKPDYNNWAGKEDYEQRFLEIIERRFA